MTSRISHHLDGATLMSFAAGSLPEPLAAAACAHVSMCAECQDGLRDMELVGAALLDASPAPSATVAIPARPSEPAPASRASRGQSAVADGLPTPIVLRYGLSLDDLRWDRLAAGVWQHRLALSPGVEGELYLVKLAPGYRLPVHGHDGSEMTLVLTGAFTDATGEYRRGDVQDVGDETVHQPVGDPELGCICLIAAERPPRFRR
jgi:putative transcriptional regulator